MVTTISDDMITIVLRLAIYYIGIQLSSWNWSHQVRKPLIWEDLAVMSTVILCFVNYQIYPRSDLVIKLQYIGQKDTFIVIYGYIDCIKSLVLIW